MRILLILLMLLSSCGTINEAKYPYWIEADNRYERGTKEWKNIAKNEFDNDMKILIHQSKDKQYYFTIVASNGRIIATSETYTQKVNCVKTAKRFGLLIKDKTKQ